MPLPQGNSRESAQISDIRPVPSMPLIDSSSSQPMVNLPRAMSAQFSSSNVTEESEFSNDRMGKTRPCGLPDIYLGTVDSGVQIEHHAPYVPV